MFMTLTGELSWQRLRRSAVDFYSKNEKNCSLSHPFGHLGVTYAWLIGKPVVDFIFVVIALFSISRTVEMLGAKIGWSQWFSKGVGHFERRFQREAGVAHHHCWYQSDYPFVWYQNICSASFSFVTIHACDGQTDGITTPKTDLAYARAVIQIHSMLHWQNWQTVVCKTLTISGASPRSTVFDFMNIMKGLMSVGFGFPRCLFNCATTVSLC